MTPHTREGSDLDPEALAELRRLARSRPRSGREAVAKASALRTFGAVEPGEASGAAYAERLVSA